MGNGLRLTGWTLYIVSLLIVFITHTGILVQGLPEPLQSAHAIFLLTAGVMNVIGFMLIIMNGLKR